MTKEQQRTLIEHTTSSSFVILAFAIFQPFGMGQLGLALYLHLALLWVLGIAVCYITETFLTYAVHHPYTWERGIEYFICRNLWFQIVNTPLIALTICLYFHYAVPLNPDPLTLRGFLSILIALTYCVFAIGFYWRFKYRNNFLAAELEEVKTLNERLQQMGKSKMEESGQVTLTGGTKESLTLSVTDLLYIESEGNYVKVCHLDAGEVRHDLLRATSKQIEKELSSHPLIVRCHRAFIVNLGQVERIDSHSGSIQLILKHSADTIPVSRSNIAHIKDAFSYNYFSTL